MWDETGTLEAVKQQSLETEDILALLKTISINFVVADTGYPLKWVKEDIFIFWKEEVRRHLYTGVAASLEDYPDAYFYFAYEWRIASGSTVIVLEKQH